MKKKLLKKMKSTLIILFITLASNAFAQKGFFETLKANGADARYQRYYDVFMSEKDGFYNISGVGNIVTFKIETLPTGEPIGFKALNVEDGKYVAGQDVINDGEVIGYPNVSYVYHTYKKNGFIAIGDYIFELKNISKDGLSYGSIGSMFIKENKDLGKKVESTEPKEEKKGKFKDFMKKAGEVALNGSDGASGGSGPEYKLASSINIKELILNHLKEMKAKQNAYTLTSADKKSIQAITSAKDKNAAYIKAYNDSIMATPEYQKGLEQQNMITLKSRSSETIYIWTKYPGKEMNSTYNTYLSNYGEETRTFCEVKTLYYTTTPLSNGAKFMREITKSDCKQTILVP